MHYIHGDDRATSSPRPSPPRPPAAPGAEGATPSRAACPERGLVGGACRYGCGCGCYCLELELESAETAVEPKPILEQRLPPPGQRGFPSHWKARTPPRLSQHASAPGPEPRSLCAACDSRVRAKPRPLPPPLIVHNCQGDLRNRHVFQTAAHRTTTKLPCP